VLIALVLVAAARQSVAAEFATAIVDGLGRPVSNVAVDVHWLKTVSERDVRRVPVLNLLSDGYGKARGTYDATSIPKGESLWVELSKTGYCGYTSTELKAQYVLRREFHAEDIDRITRMPGPARAQALKEVLAGDVKEARPSLEELVFMQAAAFRPALRTLVTDQQVGAQAAWLLAFIGVPEDVRFVVQNAPKPKADMFENRWAYGVVTALLEPGTEEEWAFLRKCALNGYEDPWVDAGAIETLRLIASPRSAAILVEANRGDADRKAQVARALDYINSKPPPLSDRSLIEAANKVAQAIKIGTWKGNGKPRYNHDGDMALVDCVFVAGRDRLTHTATFQSVGGVWTLRGVREAMQALLAKVPENEPAKPGD
jgi:hypothetical protein